MSQDSQPAPGKLTNDGQAALDELAALASQRHRTASVGESASPRPTVAPLGLGPPSSSDSPSPLGPGATAGVPLDPEHAARLKRESSLRRRLKKARRRPLARLPQVVGLLKPDSNKAPDTPYLVVLLSQWMAPQLRVPLIRLLSARPRIGAVPYPAAVLLQDASPRVAGVAEFIRQIVAAGAARLQYPSDRSPDYQSKLEYVYQRLAETREERSDDAPNSPTRRRRPPPHPLGYEQFAAALTNLTPGELSQLDG